MLDGPSVVAALKTCGITHVVWLPDTELGQWESALSSEPSIKLVRVCREGEALAIAGGLLLGGKKPVVMIQCTGFFEAGDALRNLIHDLKLPLFLIIGVRSLYAHRESHTCDSCPIFTEPIVHTWKLDYKVLEKRHSGDDLVLAYRLAHDEERAFAVLLAE
jgi:sulfopyruvate decarboxylase TPP-binding subunit